MDRGAEHMRSEALPMDFPERDRVLMTTSCRDCDSIPKVPEAGHVFDSSRGPYQLMHNGVKVVHGGYHGVWMAEIIHRLQGHHEPQEERVFHEILKHVPARATMLELGGFWSYYSLWFQHEVAGARSYILEPDPHNIEIGRRNFQFNECDGQFSQFAVGDASRPIEIQCESDFQVRSIQQTSVDDFARHAGLEFIDLLHADIQGYELQMLGGMKHLIQQRRIRFVFISTHHHSISGDPLTHQKCRRFLVDAGAHLLADHTVAESFSGDGLLVASFYHGDAQISVPISYNRASQSLFPEVEYDLASAWEELGELKSVSVPVHRSWWRFLPFSEHPAKTLD
jgi:FkbM family methyltransferase